MNYFILFMVSIMVLSCGETTQSYYSEEYKVKCNKKCLRDYGTEVDWVGNETGKCYCK